MKHAFWIFLSLLFVSCEPAPTVRTTVPNVDEPKNLKEEFELKRACFDVGRRLYEAEFNKPSEGEIALKPRYTYSRELNTCVVFAGFIGKDNTSFFLVDALSNVELASSFQFGRKTIGLSREEFKQKEKMFFPDAP